MKGTIKVLDRSGHTTVEWETSEELRTEGQLPQDEVDRRFRELADQGFTPFVKTDPEGDFEIARDKEFDPSAHEYLFVPQLQGGSL